MILISITDAKICRKGIPCGNTCIAAWKTCHVGRGSAVHISEIEAEESNRTPNTTQTPKKIDSPPGNKNIKYTFRSLGSGYFMADGEGKILKCESYCAEMAILEKGSNIIFLDKFKMVEFSTSIGSHSCAVKSCREISD